MYIIEYRFLVPDEPRDEMDALRMFMKEISNNQIPEAYLRWREFKESEE